MPTHTQSMVGYADLTLNELIAGAIGLDVRLPKWIFPELRLDDAAIAEHTRVGKESLLARGFARASKDGSEIDPNIATAIEIASEPTLIVGVVHAGEVLTASWVLGRTELLVVATRLSDELYRIRTFLPAALIGALCELTELRGDANPKEIDLLLDFEVLGRGAVAAVAASDAEIEKTRSTISAVGEAFGPPMAMSSLQIAYEAEPGQAVKAELNWLADSQGHIALCEPQVDGIRIRGLAGTGVIERIRQLLPADTGS